MKSGEIKIIFVVNNFWLFGVIKKIIDKYTFYGGRNREKILSGS